MFFKKNKNDFELKTEEDSSYYEYEDDTDFLDLIMKSLSILL